MPSVEASFSSGSRTDETTRNGASVNPYTDTAPAPPSSSRNSAWRPAGFGAAPVMHARTAGNARVSGCRRWYCRYSNASGVPPAAMVMPCSRSSGGVASGSNCSTEIAPQPVRSCTASIPTPPMCVNGNTTGYRSCSSSS